MHYLWSQCILKNVKVWSTRLVPFHSCSFLILLLVFHLMLSFSSSFPTISIALFLLFLPSLYICLASIHRMFSPSFSPFYFFTILSIFCIFPFPILLSLFLTFSLRMQIFSLHISQSSPLLPFYYSPGDVGLHVPICPFSLPLFLTVSLHFIPSLTPHFPSLSIFLPISPLCTSLSPLRALWSPVEPCGACRSRVTGGEQRARLGLLSKPQQASGRDTTLPTERDTSGLWYN